jgi:hypothetical protein
LVKGIKIWLSGFDTIKNSGGHPSESRVFFFLTISIKFDVFLFTRILTFVKERSEGILESLLPKERFFFIVINETISGFNDIIEVVLDSLHGTEENKLILDFNKIITTSF